jgi:hypothetical protein
METCNETWIIPRWEHGAQLAMELVKQPHERRDGPYIAYQAARKRYRETNT